MLGSTTSSLEINQNGKQLGGRKKWTVRALLNLIYHDAGGWPSISKKKMKAQA